MVNLGKFTPYMDFNVLLLYVYLFFCVALLRKALIFFGVVCFWAEIALALAGVWRDVGL